MLLNINVKGFIPLLMVLSHRFVAYIFVSINIFYICKGVCKNYDYGDEIMQHRIGHKGGQHTGKTFLLIILLQSSKCRVGANYLTFSRKVTIYTCKLHI